MKSIKLSIVAALLAGTTTLSADFASDVELSANVAMTSNYIWRGMTQTQNNMAIQGGFDLGYKGAYAGVWGSNVDITDGDDNSVEIDVYVGYANEISGITYDINYCQYNYPGEMDAYNFGEASLTLGYDFEVAAISAKYYVGVDTGDAENPENGYEFGVSVPLPWEMSADASYGVYGDDNSDNNNENPFGKYYSIGLTKTFDKFDVTVAYTGMNYDNNSAGYDEDGKEANLVVTLGASF